MTRILLAEDTPDSAEMLRLVLTKAGYAVDIVESGPEAIKQYERATYDLLLLDAAMPGADGFAVAEAIRVKDATTPLLMLTGHKDELTQAHANHVGIDHVLFKPIAPPELLEAIGQLLRYGR